MSLAEDWGPLAKCPVSKTLKPSGKRAGRGVRDALRCVDISSEEHFFSCLGGCSRLCPRGQALRWPLQTPCRGSLTVALGGGSRLLRTGEAQRQEAAYLSARVGPGTQRPPGCSSCVPWERWAIWLLWYRGFLMSPSKSTHLPVPSSLHFIMQLEPLPGAWPGPSGGGGGG